MHTYEIKELLKAWAAISLAFGILIYGRDNSFIFSVLVASFTVGLGFVLHELGHRIIARKFRKHAEFHADNKMLILAIIMSFFGFIFVAPGAVWISGHVTKKENGIISLAGPVANMLLAMAFLTLLPLLSEVAYYGFMINALLALFNLIPFLGFDGEKVLEWNKPVYFTLIGLAAILNLINLALPYLMR